jgi:hypothetical protein
MKIKKKKAVQYRCGTYIGKGMKIGRGTIELVDAFVHQGT